MIPALDNEPIDKGAFIAYRVDGGDAQRVRGGHAQFTIGSDGDHLVACHAVDLAGNVSAEASIHVRVDRTPPELVVFEAHDRNDPRQVVVAASDRTSGIAGGIVEIRHVAGGNGSWLRLPTARNANRFVATIPDESLSAGVYELRARVTDRAGNEAIGDRYRDGSLARVDTATLRTPTRLVAALRSVPRARSSKAGTLGRAVTVLYGRRASAHGTLTTKAGDPISGATVVVYARQAVAGGTFRLAKRVRTSRIGAFDYTAPAGPSRTLRFRYAGSPRNRAAQDEVQLRVKAAATIKADRRSVRNGRSVSFSGRLSGKPIPAAGKLLDLQAFYRGKWRTFATPRARTRDGAWKYRYRFGATTGRVVYPFRVKIRSESAYPYAAGYSKAIKVVVTG